MPGATPTEQPWPRPSYAWYVVGVLSFGYLFAFIDRIIVGLLTPAIQADLGITDLQAGLLQGLAFALFYTLFGIPLGWMADRWNRKVLLSIGMTVWSVMTAACGLSHAFWMLFLARIAVGVGEATLNPCASSLVGDYFRPRDRGRAFGVYVMGTALGTMLTYLAGGFVIGMLQRHAVVNMPLLGDMRPWQATFIAVGLPGLVPAVLFILTVKEPARRDLGASTRGQASWSETLAFLRANRVTFACQFLGIALLLMSVYGFVNWMPTYFLRIHGWTPGRFSILYGIYGGAAGVTSALTAGSVAAWMRRRGHVDATLRTTAIAGTLAIVCATVAPLMPTPSLALTFYVLNALVVNFPTVLGLVAVSEVVPNEMRALVTSLYVLLTGLLSSGLGPVAVGLVTDHVFNDRQAIGYSLALVTAVTGLSGSTLLFAGLRAYRESVARATWHASAGQAHTATARPPRP